MQQRQVSVLTREIMFSPTQTERDFPVMLLRQVISGDAGNCSYKSFILRNFEGIRHIIGGVAREGSQVSWLTLYVVWGKAYKVWSND